MIPQGFIGCTGSLDFWRLGPDGRAASRSMRVSTEDISTLDVIKVGNISNTERNTIRACLQDNVGQRRRCNRQSQNLSITRVAFHYKNIYEYTQLSQDCKSANPLSREHSIGK